MKEKQWVQHISGQGEKWEVMSDNGFQWGLKHPINSIGWHFVPKSEYRFCDPPEVWKDVTERVKESEYTPQHWFDNPNEAYVIGHVRDGYRLSKVKIGIGSPEEGMSQWAFIVEQKVTE